MQPLGNDRWTAAFTVTRLGRHLYTVEAWRDDWASYRHEIHQKHHARLAIGVDADQYAEMPGSIATTGRDGSAGSEKRGGRTTRIDTRPRLVASGSAARARKPDAVPNMPMLSVPSVSRSAQPIS